MDVEQEKAPVGVRQRLDAILFWRTVVVDIYIIVIYVYRLTTSLPNEMEISVKVHSGIAEQELHCF